MKKIMSTFLILSMTAALAAGCGRESADNTGTDGNDGASQGNTASKDNSGKEGGITFMAPDWAIPTDEQLKAFTEETGIEVTVNE